MARVLFQRGCSVVAALVIVVSSTLVSLRVLNGYKGKDLLVAVSPSAATSASLELRVQALEARIQDLTSDQPQESEGSQAVALEAPGDEQRHRACKDAGICQLGHLAQVAWSMPRGKYGGAACSSPLECASGTCAHAKCVPKKDVKFPAESRFCQEQQRAAHSANVGSLPRWLANASSKSPELERRIQMMDSCVERWRRINMPTVAPCVRCHSIASSPIIVHIHTSLLSRLAAASAGGTVCETGFNRGDSALVLATAFAEKTNVISFSINSRWYTSPGLQCLGNILDDVSQTVTYVDGYTTSTIDDFLGRNSAITCDVIHVDGCKDSPCRLYDMQKLRRAAHSSTLWVSDDIELTRNRDSFSSAYKGKKHCLFDTFLNFMHSMGLTVKCIESDSAGHGQCYGFASWDLLLKA